MSKWKAGYLVTINKKTYRVKRIKGAEKLGICSHCDFLDSSVDAHPCSGCIIGELLPEDCALVRVYTARDFTDFKLSEEELEEIENLDF